MCNSAAENRDHFTSSAYSQREFGSKFFNSVALPGQLKIGIWSLVGAKKSCSERIKFDAMIAALVSNCNFAVF